MVGTRGAGGLEALLIQKIVLAIRRFINVLHKLGKFYRPFKKKMFYTNTINQMHKFSSASYIIYMAFSLL